MAQEAIGDQRQKLPNREMPAVPLTQLDQRGQPLLKGVACFLGL